MAPASGCTTSNLGSPPLTSCCTCRRSVRFNCSPFRKRSNADIFRFAFDFTIAMSYTLCFEICQARLSWRVRHKLSDGVEWAFAGSQLATKPKIATTEVMLSDGHKGTKDGNDHSLPPGIRSVCHDPTPPSFLAHKTSTSSKQNRFQAAGPAGKPALGLDSPPDFFMKFRGPKAHPNRPQKAMVCPTSFSSVALAS